MIGPGGVSDQLGRTSSAYKPSVATVFGYLQRVNLVDELFAIAATLRAADIPYALCGGVAVTVHGATRSTKDIDILVDASDVPQILELVRPLGYTFAALPMTFDGASAKERHVQRDEARRRQTPHLGSDSGDRSVRRVA